jgi:hypothetical protein
MTPVISLDRSSEELRRTFSELGFVSAGADMLVVLQQALKAALLGDVAIFIEGETGTGKRDLPGMASPNDVWFSMMPRFAISLRSYSGLPKQGRGRWLTQTEKNHAVS